MRFLPGVCLLGLLVAGWNDAPASDCVFTRGDVNSSGVVDLNDAEAIVAFIFLGESIPNCYDSADVNDNGLVELGDYVYLVRYLFGFGPKPPAPFPDPGVDTTPGITIPTDPDPRFTFKIGTAIGYASNTGLKIPLMVSNTDPLFGFQMVFQYDGNLLR